MRNILYILAIIILTIWAVGFFFFMAGAIIHVLLLAALIALGIRIYLYIQKRKVIKKERERAAAKFNKNL